MSATPRSVGDDELLALFEERAARGDAAGLAGDVRRLAATVQQVSRWQAVLAPVERGPSMGRRAAPAIAIAATLVIALTVTFGPLAGRQPLVPASVSPSGGFASSSSPASSPAARTSPVSTPGNWTTVTWAPVDETPFGGPGNVMISDVAALGDGFLAVGEEVVGSHARGVVWRSSNGESWARVADAEGLFEDAAIDMIVVGPTAVLAIGVLDQGSTSRPIALWRSVDGQDWHRTTSPFPTSAGTGTVAAGAAGFLAASSDGSKVWLSPDGLSWKDVGSIANVDRVNSSQADIRIFAVRGAYFATARTGQSPMPGATGVRAHLWRSDDGRSWTEVTAADQVLFGHLFDARDGVLMAGGPCCTSAIVQSTNWQSNDGSAWQSLSQSTTRPGKLFDELFSDGNRIYAFSAREGRVWASFDGLEWQDLQVFVAPGISTNAASWGYLTRIAAGPNGIASAVQVDSSSNGQHVSNMSVWHAAPGDPPAGAKALEPVPEPSDHLCLPAGQECGP